MRHRPLLTFIAACGAALGLASPAAFAAWRDLVPRPVDNGGYLDLFASTQHDDNRNTGLSTQWTDDFLREKITLFSNGYFYHPRFLQYQASLSGALKQEDYRASFLETTGWRSSSGVEYDGRLMFLPEHPYNVELFARRYEPLFKEQAAIRHSNVETSRGAFFRYRLKPWFFHARYNDDEVDSGVSTSEVKRVGLGGEYFKRFVDGRQLSLAAAFNPAWYNTSYGLDGTSTEQQVTGAVDMNRVKLSVNATSNNSDQDSRTTGRYTIDQLGWYELLSIYFPFGFRSEVSYRIQDNQSTFEDPGGGGQRDLSDTSKDIQVDVIHRLYQSLDSRYTFLRDRRDSTNGDMDATSHSFVMSYTKNIPWGRVLAGWNVGRGDTVNNGRTDVISEPHPSTPVPGSFLLGQQNVVPQSIAVFLQSPLPPFQTLRLVENVHYTVTTSTNTFQINMLTLPPQFVVPGSYNLLVSYSLTTGDFELRTDTFGYNASVQLFDDLLTPYYSYSAIRSKDIGGTFPGVPLDSTTFTGGLMVHKGPIRARGEYQTVDWEVSPFHSWRGEVQVVKAFDSATRLYLTGAYLNKRYTEGTSAQAGQPYTEETESVSGSVQRTLAPRNMTLAAGGSYARLHGLVDSTAWSANASATWKIGRMDLSFGATAYTSETEGTLPVSNRRSDQYYYVRIRRELF